jgi:hypothetical protein
MPDVPPRSELAQVLLSEIAPEEEEFFAAYDAAVSNGGSNRRAGTGMGLPPEAAAALGMVAVWIGHSLFDKLLEWAGDLTGEVAKKFLVDTSVDRLKKWLLAPSKESLAGVLTTAGRVEIVNIVERDARAAGLGSKDIEKLCNTVVKKLGIAGGGED